jgi:hypothetical protein
MQAAPKNSEAPAERPNKDVLFIKAVAENYLAAQRLIDYAVDCAPPDWMRTQVIKHPAYEYFPYWQRNLVERGDLPAMKRFIRRLNYAITALVATSWSQESDAQQLARAEEVFRTIVDAFAAKPARRREPTTRPNEPPQKSTTDAANDARDMPVQPASDSPLTLFEVAPEPEVPPEEAEAANAKQPADDEESLSEAERTRRQRIAERAEPKPAPIQRGWTHHRRPIDND